MASHRIELFFKEIINKCNDPDRFINKDIKTVFHTKSIHQGNE